MHLKTMQIKVCCSINFIGGVNSLKNDCIQIAKSVF